MSGKPLKTATLLLFATLISGCVSQNAMTTLPDEVRLSVLADQARASTGDEVPGTETGGSSKEPDTGEVKLSEEELAFRARQKHAGRFSPLPQNEQLQGQDEELEEADPRQVFAQAMKLRNSATADENESDKAADDVSPTQPSQEAPVSDIWKRALALRNANSVAQYAEQPLKQPEAAGAGKPDQKMITSGVAKTEIIDVAAAQDLFVFTVVPQSASASTTPQLLNEETRLQIALRRKGGRMPKHIAIGKIAGNSHDVLKSASERASEIIAITGGDPSFGYDPLLETGTVQIEYLAGRGQTS